MNALLDAAGKLYAAVLDPNVWTPALDAVLSVAAGGHAILLCGFGEAAPLVATSRLSEENRDLFLSPLSARLFDPIQSTLPVGTVVPRQLVMSDDAFARSEVYNEVIRPADGFHSVSALERRAGGFVLSICRGRNKGMFSGDETARLEALLPHLATALEFRRRLNVAHQRSDSFADIVNRLSNGVILLDAPGRPAFANRRAELIIAEGDGLRRASNGLAAATPAASSELRQAITAVRSGASSTSRLRLPRPSKPPLLVAVMPVSRLGASIPGGPTPSVALFITEPDAPIAVDRSAIGDLFGLTRRESEVAALLAEGHSLPTIAETLGLSVGATRQYLKRAFDKTGRHNQASLVALLRGFSAC